MDRDNSLQSSMDSLPMVPEEGTEEFRNAPEKVPGPPPFMPPGTDSSFGKHAHAISPPALNNKSETPDEYLVPLKAPPITNTVKTTVPPRSQSIDMDGSLINTKRPATAVRRSVSLGDDNNKAKMVPDSPSGRRASIILPGSLANKVSTKSQNIRSSVVTFFGSKRDDDTEGTSSDRQEMYNRQAAYREYSVGDAVLVFANQRFVSSVNRDGFPPGQGRTADERNGPYLFVLGKIKQIHFEENSVFYTVRREDTGVDVRGNPSKFSIAISFSVYLSLILSSETYFLKPFLYDRFNGAHQIQGR